MPLKINANSLQIQPSTILEVPNYTKFLEARLDHRHNNCLLWWIGSDEADVKKEKVEVLMLQLDHALEPQSAKFVGSFKANQGEIFIFVSRTSDNPLITVPHVKEAVK